MNHLEDLRVGALTNCGSFSFDADAIVTFAGRYDPQPYHLDHGAVGDSLFAQLSASGLQTCATARKLVLQTVMQRAHFLGSPGLVQMLLARPVYADAVVHVRHRIEKIDALAQWPGVGLVHGVTEGHDAQGQEVFSLKELSWIGARSLAPDFEVDLLRRAQAASEPLGPLRLKAVLPIADQPSRETGRLHVQDCETGTVFYSREQEVSAQDVQPFHRQFDAPVATPGRAALVNEWLGPCLAMRALHDAFWGRARPVAGGGTDGMRWGVAVRAGDRVRAQLRMIQARPLRSRPGVGLVQGECTCVNQRDEVVTSFLITAFIGVRATD